MYDIISSMPEKNITAVVPKGSLVECQADNPVNNYLKKSALGTILVTLAKIGKVNNQLDDVHVTLTEGEDLDPESLNRPVFIQEIVGGRQVSNEAVRIRVSNLNRAN